MVAEGEEGSREVEKGYIEKFVIATGRVGRGWGGWEVGFCCSARTG